mmetsp:Transcript_34949/g.56396  ORF Transcript_34949/g.56396 Transcript_34949/m.56396 type:complete len:117 (-) Transcript_34949:1474-1824(-)
MTTLIKFVMTVERSKIWDTIIAQMLPASHTKSLRSLIVALHVQNNTSMTELTKKNPPPMMYIVMFTSFVGLGIQAELLEVIVPEKPDAVSQIQFVTDVDPAEDIAPEGHETGASNP